MIDIAKLKALHPSCGYESADNDGMLEPCGEPATAWRWYQDVEHEDCLLPACADHANEGGRIMAELLADNERMRREIERLRAYAAEWHAEQQARMI